jgi:hypothetical protein
MRLRCAHRRVSVVEARIKWRKGTHARDVTAELRRIASLEEKSRAREAGFIIEVMRDQLLQRFPSSSPTLAEKKVVRFTRESLSFSTRTTRRVRDDGAAINSGNAISFLEFDFCCQARASTPHLLSIARL